MSQDAQTEVQRAAVTPRPPIRTRRRRIANRRAISRRESAILGVAGVVGGLVIWELAARLGLLNPLLSSSPTRVARSLADLYHRGVLVPAFLSSAKLFGIGFGLALAIGLPVGAAIGWYPRLRAIFDPWVSLIYASPRIAFIPLIVLWAGIGLHSQIVLVVLIAIFPIIINTATGIGTVDRDHMRLARAYLASDHDVLFTIALPGSVPTVIAGIRQGMIQALLGTVAAEYFIGYTGLGGVIFTAGLTLQTGQAFAGALVFAFSALLLTALLRAIERRFDRWRT
jgi:NitT/TauT family transport system permease protein